MGWETQFRIDVHGPFYAVQLFKHENKHPFSNVGWESWDNSIGYEKIFAPGEYVATFAHKCLRMEAEKQRYIEEEDIEEDVEEDKAIEDVKEENTEKTEFVYQVPSLVSLVSKEICLNISAFKNSVLLPKECYFEIFKHFSSEELLRTRFEDLQLQAQLEHFRENASAALFYKYEARKGCYKLDEYIEYTKKFPVCIHIHMTDDCGEHYGYFSTIYRGVEDVHQHIVNDIMGEDVPKLDCLSYAEYPLAQDYKEFYSDVTEFDYFREVDEKVFSTMISFQSYYRTSVKYFYDQESKAEHLYQREPKPREFPALSE